MPPTQQIVFLSWTDQWRAERISAALGTKTVTPARFAMDWPWPIRYLAQGLASVAYLLRHRPDAVIYTNPPPVTGAFLVPVARLTRTTLWADCHSGPWTEPRWMRFGRLHRWVMRKGAGALLHNPQILSQHGHETPRPVLSWTPPLLDLSHLRAEPEPLATPYVAAVMSYAFDEPIDELLAAASLVPQLTFKLTGKAPAEVQQKAPANIEFTGYVPVEDFASLLANSAVVLCLTSTPDTMQQGIADALEVGVQGVTSDNPTMQEWRDGTDTCFLVPWDDPAAIAEAIRRATSADHVYDAAGRTRLLERSHTQFAELLATINEARR